MSYCQQKRTSLLFIFFELHSARMLIHRHFAFASSKSHTIFMYTICTTLFLSPPSCVQNLVCAVLVYVIVTKFIVAINCVSCTLSSMPIGMSGSPTLCTVLNLSLCSNLALNSPGLLLFYSSISI